MPFVGVGSSEGGKKTIKLHNRFPPSAILVPGPFEEDQAKNGVRDQQERLPAVPLPIVVEHIVWFFISTL